jgi:hypothetical protein
MVLVMSLIILLILTLLGITAMNTSSLEERMSGNTQEGTRAFQSAESGLNESFNTAGNFDLNTTQTHSYSYDSGKSGSATVVTSFVEYSTLRRNSGSGSNFEAANFEQTSTGATTTGARSVLHQGVAQVIPKSN